MRGFLIPKLVAELTSLLGADGVLSDPCDLEVYSYDATLRTAAPDVVVLPRNTDEVAAVVRACAEYGVPLTPRGSATSLSGGPVPVAGGVVVSLTRMNRIIEIDEENLRVVVQPGIINADLDEVLAARGLVYAPDPASQIACTLGGNVAENAGGPHCLKYGVTANHVTGLIFVGADGSVMELGGPALVSTGLDLRGIVIGSEGTLGIVTQITCRLMPAPAAVATVLACFASIEDAAAAVSDIIAKGLLPAALEMADRVVIEAIEKWGQMGYPEDVEAVLVIELDGLPEALRPQIDRVEAICSRNHVLRFEWAEDATERELLWRGRKGATAALALVTPARFSTDVTVPRSKLPQALYEVAGIARRFNVLIGNVFHAGDGNLHPQVLFDPRDQEEMARATAADEAITEMALRLGGVITGEHGIGCEKRKWMTRAYSAFELRALQAVKLAFDPRGLLNPGKVLPEDEEIKARERVTQYEVVQDVSVGLVSPTTEEAVVDLLGACERDGLPLNLPDHSVMFRPGCVELSLQQLKACRDYDASNLTVTVEAGMTVGELQALLAEQGQTLGAWRGLLDQFTVGQLVATGHVTPSLTRYGAVRDIVTGLRVVSRGHLLRAGSSCVKNASGYALERLFVGSFCSLGVLLAATLRTHPLPEAEHELVISPRGKEGLAGLVRELSRCPAMLSQVVAWPPGRGPWAASSPASWTVGIRVDGWEKEVRRSAEIVSDLASAFHAEIVHTCDPLAEAASTPVFRERDTSALWAGTLSDVLRFSLKHPEAVLELWPLVGLVRAVVLAKEAGEADRLCRLPASAEDLYQGPPTATRDIIERLKRAFDPQKLLPPW